LLESYDTGKSKNYILKNYYDFIKEEVGLYQNYKKLKISTWEEKAYQGFFYYLSEKLNKNKNITKTGFGYHDNPNGGHWSLWFGNDKKIKNKYGEKICFHLNLETSNYNGNKEWLCRLIIRTDGRKDDTKWDKKDIEQFIGTIGEKIMNKTGKYIILAKLFQIDNESKINNYLDLEKKIMAELDRFIEWQNKEGFK